MPQKKIEPIIYQDAWHKELADLFISILLEYVFKPLADELSDSERADNAKISDLEKALKTGAVHFQGGVFKGKINAAISKEIKSLGGRFSRGFWRLASPSLPSHLQRAIATCQSIMKRLSERFNSFFRALPDILTERVQNMDLESLGVRGMDRVSKEFKRTVGKAYAVYPDLGEEGKQRFVEGYIKTEDKPIRKKVKQRVNPALSDFENAARQSFENFAQSEVETLRNRLTTMLADGRPRYEIRQEIIDRLKISKDRARFIARQETALYTTKFKEIEYTNAGILKYQWVTAKDHVVRDTPNGGHKALDGKVFSWDNPPSADHFSCGQECHPNEDYNCRCIAKPIVEW